MIIITVKVTITTIIVDVTTEHSQASPVVARSFYFPTTARERVSVLIVITGDGAQCLPFTVDASVILSPLLIAYGTTTERYSRRHA